MIYFVWTLPALLVIAAIASGQIGVLAASAIGLASALVVAFAAAPHSFQLAEAAVSLARGVWIGWIIVPYIVGGLLFWQIAMRTGDAGTPTAMPMPNARAGRRLLFMACFLIGPFAESATGFGVGIIGTMALVRRLQIKPIQLLVFSLISQTMILWGAMGSGAIIAAALARTNPTALAVHASILVVGFNIAWLVLYWRLADRAGFALGPRERLSEALWLGTSLALVVAATAVLGPETAMLAAYGPVIALRYLVDERPDRRTLGQMFRRMLPFGLLIAWLGATRLVAPLEGFLLHAGRLHPFAGAPAWAPLFHAGTWLLVAAVLTGLLRGHARAFPVELRAAWTTGRLAILSIFTFSAMAEVLSGSGIATGLAQGLFQTFGRAAVVVMPILSAVYGVLANSSNGPNGLFMAAQVSLATEAGLNLAAAVALQHVAAFSLNIVSPVRMSIACSLAGTPGHERDAYRAMLPFAVAAVALLLVAAILVASGRV
ncbi:L-lactate permease [Belnapia sp. T6]|uniref:L-lactate permease n=1 Tax=Belnapia mucosa TaxID=2804532 RepID=A0ABS1VDB8_9PROT|nr:L-lactate permease [Belnapia mucosa]MBL6459111.1 L-lactate permease [Belnapia mucosa]